MSHAHGQCRFQDGAILFFEYNGTADFCCTALRESHAEVSKHWRDDNERECVCGEVAEKVELANEYGNGESWDGTACRQCMAIVSGVYAMEQEDTREGLPSWYLSPEVRT